MGDTDIRGAPLQAHECVSHSVMPDSLRPPWTRAHEAPPSVEFSRQEGNSNSLLHQTDVVVVSLPPLNRLTSFLIQ